MWSHSPRYCQRRLGGAFLWSVCHREGFFEVSRSCCSHYPAASGWPMWWQKNRGGRGKSLAWWLITLWTPHPFLQHDMSSKVTAACCDYYFGNQNMSFFSLEIRPGTYFNHQCTFFVFSLWECQKKLPFKAYRLKSDCRFSSKSLLCSPIMKYIIFVITTSFQVKAQSYNILSYLLVLSHLLSYTKLTENGSKPWRGPWLEQMCVWQLWVCREVVLASRQVNEFARWSVSLSPSVSEPSSCLSLS